MSNRKTVFMTFVFRGLSAFLTFANSVVAARYLLNPGDRGDFQTSVTYATSGQRYSGGYSNYFSRSLPRRPEDAEMLVQMGNFVMFMMSICVWLIALAVTWFGHPSFIVFFSLVGMPLTFLFGYASRLLNALDDIRALNIANVSQAVVFLLVYLGFIVFNPHIHEHHRLMCTYRIWLLSWVVCVVYTLFAVYKRLGFGGHLKWKWYRTEWKEFMGFGTWSSLALLSGYVNLRIDFWMLGWILPHNHMGRVTVSVYGIAVTAAEILMTLSQSIGTVVFRKMSASSGMEASTVTENASRQTLLTSIIISIALAVLMPVLVFVYGYHKYGGSIGPFYILLPGLILKTVSTLIAQYFTNTRGKPFTLLVVNLMMIVFNALICFLLIPHLGMYGASISSTIAYFAELSVYVFWYSKTADRPGRYLWLLEKSDLQPYLEICGGILRRVRSNRTSNR